MKIFSPSDYELLFGGSMRRRSTHAMCMEMIKNIRQDPNMDNIVFVTPHLTTQAKVYRLLKNQLPEYTIATSYQGDTYIVTVNRPVFN